MKLFYIFILNIHSQSVFILSHDLRIIHLARAMVVVDRLLIRKNDEQNPKISKIYAKISMIYAKITFG
jgi:hypothetical protein